MLRHEIIKSMYAPPGFSDLPLVLYLDLAKIIMPWMSSTIYPSIFGKVKRNQWSFMLITIIYTKYWIHRLKELGRQDDVLAGKLSFYQGCLPYEADQDGGMDGKCREIHFQNHGWQSLHIGWIQAREGQLPRKYLHTSLLSIVMYLLEKYVLNSKFSKQLLFPSTQCKNKSLWNVDCSYF